MLVFLISLFWVGWMVMLQVSGFYSRESDFPWPERSIKFLSSKASNDGVLGP